MQGIDLQKAMREESRWRILRTLDAGRPMTLNETLIWRALNDIELPLTPRDVRRELDYLRDCGLVEIVGEGEPTWGAHLTAQGVDVVEYAVPAPPGVTRPRRW